MAEHENERRWLSLDLLCGKVVPGHAWHGLMLEAGIAREELEMFLGLEARPDLIGINHYLTSERFLDHRTGLYPGLDPGGNGRDTYVDAEAVRVKSLEHDIGLGPRLREAWKRYEIPMAITEVHHGCHRDEQLRWFAEVWKTAHTLRDEGMDLRAVTLWSLFGNVDWRFLLTERHGFYDTGAFDVRNGVARPTIVAKAAKAYSEGEDFDHPLLDSPGWWRRSPRLYPWSRCRKPLQSEGRKLLITGATGTLGRAFARICEERALPYGLTTREELDIDDTRSIARAIENYRPWAIVNAAGFVRVADAERERQACMAANASGPEKLARACAKAGLPLVTFSSDLVFDGSLGRPYVESDAPNPGNAYGLSKAEAERRVLAASDRALVIRASAFFGPWDRHNFAWNVLNQIGRGEPLLASPMTEVSPTYVPDLVHAALDLLIDGEAGIWHLANQGSLSWHRFAQLVAEGAGYDASLVLPLDGAKKFTSTALTSERGIMLRPLGDAIAEFIGEVAERIETPPHMRVAAE